MTYDEYDWDSNTVIPLTGIRIASERDINPNTRARTDIASLQPLNDDSDWDYYVPEDAARWPEPFQAHNLDKG